MSSQDRCLFAAGGDSYSSPVNGSESDVAVPSDRVFLIGVAGGTASGKVMTFSSIAVSPVPAAVNYTHSTDGATTRKRLNKKL